jgi:hypothetical protein
MDTTSSHLVRKQPDKVSESALTIKPMGPLKIPDAEKPDPKRSIEEKLLTDLVRGVFKLIEKFPLEDHPSNRSPDEDLHRYYVRGAFKDLLSHFDTVWDWNSPTIITDLFFRGLGQWYVKKGESTLSNGAQSAYSVDFRSIFTGYEVRSHFAGYDVNLYFDAQRQCLGIEDGNEFVPFNLQDKQFRHFWARARAALLVDATVRLHLIHTHWTISGKTALARLTTLEKDSPLNRLLKIFTFGAVKINSASVVTLAPYKAIVGRVCVLTKGAWERYVNYCISCFVPQTLQQHQVEMGFANDDSLPLYRDGNRYWSLLSEFVTEFTNIAPQDALLSDFTTIASKVPIPSYKTGDPIQLETVKLFLTYVMFNVTGMHAFFGAITEYLTHNNALAAKIAVGQDVADNDTFVQSICLIALTSTPTVMLANQWGFMFSGLKGAASYDLVCTKFLERLYALSYTLKSENINETVPFLAFNPANMGCSVSV